MLNTLWNNYINNPKETVVNTPRGLCKFLFDIISPLIPGSGEIVDVCCNTGRLSSNFSDWQIIGYDIKSEDQIEKTSDWQIKRYSDKSFIELDKPVFGEQPILVLSNPPWNNPESLYGRALMPEVFTKKVFKLYGYEVPFVLLVPFTFRLNQEMNSTRFRYLRDANCKVSSIVSVPRNFFDGVNIQNEVVIFNLKGLEPHYFIPDKYLYR